MLTPTTPIAVGPMAAATAEGPQDEPGTAFAQALDQAEAQQREAGPAEGPETPRRPDGRRTPARTDARQPADAVRGDATAADVDAAPAAHAPAESDDDKQAEALPTDPTPQELCAWMSALPLPRPPAARATVPDGEAVAEAASPRPARKAEPLSAPTVAGEQPSAVQGKDRSAVAQARTGTRVPPEPASGHEPGTADAASNSDSARPVTAAREVAAAPAAGAAIGGHSLGMQAAAASSHPARSTGPGTPLQAELRATVGSDEFAPALGARISVLVRDGIEHARLNLNPAELGPIEVRIELDGQRAQVDFSAAHATTRQALQDAVPALASALRESGLTLTGGGVFEQPREQRGDTSPQHARHASATTDRTGDDRPPAAIAPRPSRTRGVLDVYA